MGNIRTWWVFGFEWWGSLRPAEMITTDDRRYIPLFWGLWLRAQQNDDMKYQAPKQSE